MLDDGDTPPHGDVVARLQDCEEMFRIRGTGLDLFLLRDFLSEEECALMIELVDAYNYPSRVMGASDDAHFRTSRSAPLAWSRHPLVDVVNARVSRCTGIPESHQESIEGQRYEPGQEFKPHFDTFPTDKPYWPEQERLGGQRTWTAMICVGQPDNGGGTAFPVAGVRINPRAGNLLLWNNLTGDGHVNPASLHCGEPVEAGTKYVLTKWHRERPFTPDRRQKSGGGGTGLDHASGPVVAAAAAV